jgi:restriction endonuclease S subunit
MAVNKIDLNNLDKSNWKSFRFDEIAQNISERVDPNNTNLEVYIGLEHIDSESLHIKRFGTPDDVNGQKLKFYKGDIIFGRRRAYQRKAGIATCDGFCSAHALVLRANPDVIDPDLFPFFMHSDLFMNRAIDISVGSLSPTINWGTLKHQKFIVPPKDIQISLSRLLWKKSEVLESGGELEARLEVLRKSYMKKFRTPSSDWKKFKIKELMSFSYGKALKESDRVVGEYPVVSSSGIQGMHDSSFVEGPGIVVGRKGNVGETTWVDKDFWPIDTAYYIEQQEDFRHIPLRLIFFLLQSTDFTKFSIATAVPGLNRDDALAMNVYVPNEAEIPKILNDIDLIDEQISLLKRKMDSSKALQKTIINQVF